MPETLLEFGDRAVKKENFLLEFYYGTYIPLGVGEYNKQTDAECVSIKKKHEQNKEIESRALASCSRWGGQERPPVEGTVG